MPAAVVLGGGARVEVVCCCNASACGFGQAAAGDAEQATEANLVFIEA